MSCCYCSFSGDFKTRTVRRAKRVRLLPRAPKAEGGLNIYVYMALFKISNSFQLVVSRHCLCTVMWPTEGSHFVQGARVIYAMQLLFRNVAMAKYTRVISFLVDALSLCRCRPALLPKQISGSSFEVLNTPAMLSRFPPPRPHHIL